MDPGTLTAEVLFDMRLARHVVPALPTAAVPESQTEAYRAQSYLVQKLLASLGGKPIGFKAAATNESAQKALNVSGPFFGVLLSATTHSSPVALPSANFTVRCVEAEFGFEIGEDVPHANEPWTAESVKPFVAALIPAIEVVDHRFQDWKTVGAESLIADNAIHGAWVEGTPVRDWRHLDLSQHAVVVTANGAHYSTGSGAAVLGHPLNVVAWLANELHLHGHQLKRGDKLTTGTAADVYLANPGDRVTADFGSLGRVEIAFDP